MKIYKFPDEGVTVKIPNQSVHGDVFVEKKPKGADPPPQGFGLITVAINLAFYVLDDNGNKMYVNNLNPPAKLQIRYDNNVMNQAQGKKKKLAWWDAIGNNWVLLNNTNTSRKHYKWYKNWEGYGVAETRGWDKDPPVGWGC